MKTTEFKTDMAVLRNVHTADWSAWVDVLESHLLYNKPNNAFLIQRNLPDGGYDCRLFYSYDDLEEFMVFNGLLEGPYGSSEGIDP